MKQHIRLHSQAPQRPPPAEALSPAIRALVGAAIAEEALAEAARLAARKRNRGSDDDPDHDAR